MNLEINVKGLLHVDATAGEGMLQKYISIIMQRFYTGYLWNFVKVVL